MCVMSAVTDHYQQQWPVVRPEDLNIFKSYPIFELPKITITPQQWAEYMRLKQAAADIDRVTGQPDCVKPGVDKWEEACVKLVEGQTGNSASAN